MKSLDLTVFVCHALSARGKVCYRMQDGTYSICLNNKQVCYVENSYLKLPVNEKLSEYLSLNKVPFKQTDDNIVIRYGFSNKVLSELVKYCD